MASLLLRPLRNPLIAIRDLSVVHIGPGRYRPGDRDHVSYQIWRELASGFRSYHVIGRSIADPADWSDGNLRITLVRSYMKREIEFLFMQFAAVRPAVRSKPDVVLCQSPPLGGLAALVVSRKTQARVLMELHGADFFGNARIGSRLWLLQHLTGFALARADRIRVLSTGMLQSLVDRYGASLADRTSVLPPRVDLGRFGGCGHKTIENGLEVAMVGAVNENKGQLKLIRALDAAPFRIALHIIGEGPDLDECRARSARLSRKGSKLSVKCHGRLPHAAVASVLQSCNLLVMYSTTEATPRAIIEAMASGLPVITTDAGFCADIIEHGREGFVLGADPDSEIVPVLDRFRVEPLLAQRMGAAARKRAHRDYDSVRLFDEYRTLIAETAAV